MIIIDDYLNDNILIEIKNDSIFKNPLGIGLDIETGGHVFQLLFSNSQSMNAINLMSSSTGDWTEGDVFFGFNLYRTF